LQHRLARFGGANSLVAAKRMETLGEIIQIFAFDGVNDADALDEVFKPSAISLTFA
jgi:hypothetical protein